MKERIFGELPELVQISEVPAEIVLSELIIERNQCIRNAYNVSEKYSDVDIIEGIIVPIDTKNGARAMPHMWNKKGNIHFDVTNKAVWKESELIKEVREVRYFATFKFQASDVEQGVEVSFSPLTFENTEAMNHIISRVE